MPPPVFDARRLLDQTFLEQVEVRRSLPSTNDRALKLCRDESLKLPAVVVAEQQTAGRGRQGKSWASAQGSLTFSLVCEQPAGFSFAQVSLLAALSVATMVDVAVSGAAKSNNDKSDNAKKLVAKVKWPNDVYVDDRKLAGLLVEAPHTPCNSPRVVIGIGVNVNNDCRLSSDETHQAVALGEVGSCEFPLEDALIGILQSFESMTRPTMNEQERLKLRRRMLRERCYLSGKQVIVRSKQEDIGGFCEGIGDEGALLVRLADGTLRRIVSGTVVSHRP